MPYINIFMLDIENYPPGYYECGEKKFINKFDALCHGKKQNLFVNYIYFDNVWQNFNRDLIGKSNLDQLYKERAQQLRDKYDYLILYFSGGADSYNVLKTFLNNGIKLDEVCVKWCKDSLNSHTKIYQPNTNDLTAYNYLSEWDYAIKPVLEEISKCSDIKIEIVDWFKNKDEKTIDLAFQKVNHWHDIEVNSLACWSPSEFKMFEKGKKVGSIYGIDKPVLYFEKENVYMCFLDSALSMGTPNSINLFGTEYFYYCPDFPLLTFEMANTAAKVYNLDKFSKFKITKPLVNFIKKDQFYQKFIRQYLYTTWTNRFQAFKPMAIDRYDKHFWIVKHPEFKNYTQIFQSYFKDYLNALGEKWYKSESGFYKVITSKKHFVCSLTDT